MIDNHDVRNYDLILGSIDEWSQMLELFCKASCLTGSIYLDNGKKVLGPFIGSTFGEFFQQNNLLEDYSTCCNFEVEQVLKIEKAMSTTPTILSDVFKLRTVPIKVENHILGYVVFGWIFDHFPDPIECNKLARLLKLQENSFWQAARIQAPISSGKVATYEAMLKLLCTTLMQQLISLRQANHTARLKDELLATVSHELKTPLTTIILKIQMMKKGMIKPERLPEFINSLERSANIQANLIEDLLDAAKVITGKFVVNPLLIDLKDILQKSIETIEDSAQTKNISIESLGLNECYPFMGDSIRLQQAFCNLLTNSVKFTPANGHIVVKMTQNISSYTIKFSDDGTGIEPSFMPSIFKKFSQHESKIGLSQAGLGLGLSLVKTIVDLHYGTIEVESPGLGKGTTFEITLNRDRVLLN
ncbi:MAG: PocR ligand-binding domain-containing protein [Bacteriovorax sp.]|nr:PocR ligand-binding domain-containing protein [Bacteriovorax sp.]